MLQNHEHSTFSMKKICQNSPRNVLKKRIVKDQTEKVLKKDNSIRIFLFDCIVFAQPFV